jgi:tRNA G18 (ribose-2'-O)-methylase SpoU
MPHPLIDSLTHPLAQIITDYLQSPANSNKILIEDSDNIRKAKEYLTITHLICTDADNAPNDCRPHHPHELWQIKPRTLKKCFGATRQPKLFALADRPASPTLADLANGRDLVILDDLQITGNIGAICRSAAAFNAAGLISLNPSIDPYDRRIVRASRGHVFDCPVMASTPKEVIDFCQQQGIDLVHTAANGNTTLMQLQQHHGPLAWVFGSEKFGIQSPLTQHSQHQVRIPMSDQVESLNVSVAASICLHSRFLAKLNNTPSS